jgi:crossover junction endodeoxyribonuclease RuvC
MIILGIDPGSRATGFGLVRVDGKSPSLVEYGSIALGTDALHGDRLRHIYEQVMGLIEQHSPTCVAIEMPVYAKNPQSMLKLGRAQAAAMLAALNNGLTVDEYTPKEVKKAVTGNGNAAKEQVGFMVAKILELPPSPSRVSLDALDALAVALCRAHRMPLAGAKSGRGWDAFVRANSHRVIP